MLAQGSYKPWLRSHMSQNRPVHVDTASFNNTAYTKEKGWLNSYQIHTPSARLIGDVPVQPMCAAMHRTLQSTENPRRPRDHPRPHVMDARDATPPAAIIRQVPKIPFPCKITRTMALYVTSRSKA